MLTDHDQDFLLRCRRLGHEINFGYCRRESGGQPCRLILDCWWEQFDVRTFLQAHLSEEDMRKIERSDTTPPPAKLFSLLDQIQQAKDRLKDQS